MRLVRGGINSLRPNVQGMHIMCLQLLLLQVLAFGTGAGGGKMLVGGRPQEAFEKKWPCQGEGEWDLEHLRLGKGGLSSFLCPTPTLLPK